MDMTSNIDSIPPITILGMEVNGVISSGNEAIKIFTEQDLLNLRNYSEISKSISKELYSVLAMLESEKKGLRSSLFLDEITVNGNKWSFLEKSIMSLAKSLCCYGENISDIASRIIADIDSMPLMKKLSSIESELYYVESRDKIIRNKLSSLLARLVGEATQNKHEAGVLASELQKYRLEMDNEIIPQGSLIRAAIMQIPDLTATNVINDKKYEINVRHGKFLEKRPITSGILRQLASAKTSLDAEKVMKDVRTFIEPIDKILQFACSGIEEIYTLIYDASLSVKALEILWDTIIQNAEQSKRELDSSDNSTKLLIFKNKMSTVISSWCNIVGSADIFKNK